MRATTYAWWCNRGHKNGPENRRCAECDKPRFERHAQVHTSERAVVYYNPATGERRTPARADTPIPEVYASAGFERMEIMNMSQFERDTGLVHEATNFSPGNEPSPLNPADEPRRLSKGQLQPLVDDMRAAFASGPFTGGL